MGRSRIYKTEEEAKEANKQRAKAYHQANKDDINAKRRADYRQKISELNELKQFKKEHEQQQISV